MVYVASFTKFSSITTKKRRTYNFNQYLKGRLLGKKIMVGHSTQHEEQIFRLVIHESTIQRIEKITGKYYNRHYGDKLINEALTKLQRSKRKL